jgi:hypothetical protein
MHPRLSQVAKISLLAPSILLLSLSMAAAGADDSSFLGRLFRLGNPSPSGASSAPPSSATANPYGRGAASTVNSAQPAPGSGLAPTPLPTFGGLPQTPVTTPPLSANGPGQRLSPKPRFSPAVTTADPLLTRLALGRSNDGSQFGMIMQIFADGTVIDSEGVHRIRPADLKPIIDSVASGELFRIRGHCGAPSTDFIEYVHIVVYERRFGRLWAHAFSYSGNPQGCDHGIRHLHTALENLQAKLSRAPVTNSSGIGSSPEPAPLGSPTAAPTPPAVDPGGGAATGPVIQLSPLDQ